jgi:SPP1 family predicted phage head-tail adaptor
MTAPFRLNGKVTIEKRTVARDPDYGTEVENWEVVASRVWANVQDMLPSRGESTTNGLVTSLSRTRLRIRIRNDITSAMRVTLHGKGDRVMQIVAGPALLDDRRHMEFMLEGYKNGG